MTRRARWKWTAAVLAPLALAIGPATALGAAPTCNDMAVGVLASAGSAGAAYQHNQTDLEFAAAGITDGTSNTIMFGVHAAH